MMLTFFPYLFVFLHLYNFSTFFSFFLYFPSTSNPYRIYFFQIITSMNVGTSASAVTTSTTIPFELSAVASLEYLPFNQKTGFSLIMIGTMDGSFESWKICAYEAEEEEDIVHVDEEDATIKLKFVKYFSKQIFHSTLSMISCSAEEKKFFYVTLGSVFEERIFVLKLSTDFSAPVNLSFAINLKNSPSSCVWLGRTFWIGCTNGLLCSFTPSRGQKEEKNECVPHAYWECSLPSVSNLCSGYKGEYLVLTSHSNDMLRTFPVQSESNSTTLSSVLGNPLLNFRNPYKDSVSNSDLIVCVTCSPSGSFIATGCVDGCIHIFSTTNGDLKLVAKANLHKQTVLSLAFSVDSSVLMSCGADGSTFLSTISAPNRLFFKAALGDSKFYEKVLLIDKNESNDMNANTVNTTINLHSHNSTQNNNQNQNNNNNLNQNINNINLDSNIPIIKTRTWFEIKKSEALDELKKKSSLKVGEVSSTFEDISVRLKSILDRNNGRSEQIEKLDRSELVIDLDGRDKTLLENEVLLDSTRLLYAKRNLFNEVVASRVKESCWDCMEAIERNICPFNVDDKIILTSFSIQNATEQSKRRLEVVKRLRAIEIRTQRAHSQGISQKLATYETSVRTSWTKAVHGFSSAISWVANDGNRWPTQNIIATLLRKERGEDPNEIKVKEKDAGDKGGKETDGANNENGVPKNGINGQNNGEDEDEVSTTSIFESDREMDENSIFNLLYAPEAVRTQAQKRTQIILLTEVARLLRANFNSFFEELAGEKEDVISSVESRNARLQSILIELKQDEILFIPKLSNIELKGAAIIITDDELISRPYESESVTIARAKEEELRKKMISENETEDFKGRALIEMMNGTLEVKRDVFADVSLFQKPQWMDDLSQNEMSESQVKEVEAFEAKLKLLQEEQLKYRKSLEQEMKKLKSETTEACKLFDEKVANVARIKVLVQREILTQELYTARLGLTMAKREQSWSLLKKTESQIEVMRKERGELKVKSEKFNIHVESMKNNLNSIQEEERGLDKTFKRDFQTLCNNNFDQDSLKVFADLFRRREYAPSPEDDDDASQDPDAEESDMLISGSARGSHRRSKATSSSRASKKNNNAGSKRTKGMSSSKKNGTLGSSKKGGAGGGAPGGVGAGSRMMKASKGGNARSNAAGGKERLGPMQEAAQALKNAQQPEVNEKDPFLIDLLQKEKLVRIAESKIPLLMSLNIESDCPENFVVDQYTWSKLQDLRNIRIEKEIASKRMAVEYAELKRKLDDLINEEGVLVSCIGGSRQSRDETLKYLESIETNLEVLVCLKQGQDEVDKDAVVTEYGDAVLVPTSVVDKYNIRIKELGREKVSVLSRIKQYRRKINLTEWNSHHLMLESRHMEEYFTDLQLLRVTRELQQVIRDGSNTEQTKVSLFINFF